MTRSLLTLATVAFSTIHNAHAFGPEYVPILIALVPATLTIA